MNEPPKAAKAARPGCKEWFDLAHRLKLVTASPMMGMEQYVLINENKRELWGFLVSAFTIARLSEILAE
ncbi:hypothetical protein [Trichocoleus sp. FACHB-262]|uniref:hypothetical protein n=1 Tax=Trichocoleus sp. FACHB-262 TaxID=2692869 RepID=UPI0016896248|nr:hypothetical protein [Trichocoleus sp. FACHB-262]MBD2121319.1 hypothetical protein [Trichocoleus sp. FACHB-262]